MSLLYKSLQRLRREGTGPGSGPYFASGSGDRLERRRLIKVGGVALALTGLVLLLGVLVRGQLTSYLQVLQGPSPSVTNGQAPFETRRPVSNRQTVPRTAKLEKTTPADRSPKGGSKDQVLAPTDQLGAGKASAAAQQVATSAKADPDSATKLDGEESATRPRSSKLDRHFSRQAKRNRQVLTLSRSLQRDLQRGDLQGLAADLTDLQGLMPQGSPLVSRWEGVLALEQGRLKRAQDCFRRVLAEIPDDFSAQVNLALALVRDGKDQQARRLVDKLLEIRPESKLVKGLSRRLDRLGRP